MDTTEQVQCIINLIQNAGQEGNPLPIMDFSEQGFSNDYISQHEILRAFKKMGINLEGNN